MNAKDMGEIIAKLRKKAGLTQQTLAEKLDVTDKAISKWENGQCYPDITVLPKIANLFGVTVDYLMFGNRKKIVVAGNIITDIIKNIDIYPEAGMLAKVSDISYTVGGCVPNTAISLSKIDTSIPISVMGRVGTDENGRYIISQMQKYGINVNDIKYSEGVATSFCDVMSMSTGERTFFHKKGANAEFCPDDVDVESLDCEIFHIGYILLLDEFDKEDAKYGTVMAGFLKKLQDKGIKTSIDVVSDSDAKTYGAKIIPVLKYCNYVIMNEIECCNVWNLSAYTESGELNRENIKKAMKLMAEEGVSEKIIIHSKKVSFALDKKSGEFTEVPSLKIPKEKIKGSVGAGDAFCAGSLYGLYNGFSDKEILEFASAAAACNLFAENSIDGMKSKSEIYKIADEYGRLSI